MPLRFSLREHRRFSGYKCDIRFLKPSASVLRIDSYQAGADSWGWGWAFFIAPREWLNGKWLRWRWGGYFSSPNARKTSRVLIYDGEYDRTNDNDFPEFSDIPTKGNGLLQRVYEENVKGHWGMVTRDVQIDTSSGILDKCTVFFRMNDGWAYQTVYTDIDWVEINEQSNGEGNLYREDFVDDVHMERTGTTKDYGYISEGEITPYIPQLYQYNLQARITYIDMFGIIRRNERVVDGFTPYTPFRPERGIQT